MVRKISSLIFILLTGCGSFQKPDGIYNQSPDFRAYTNAYLEYKQMYLGEDNVEYAINVEFYHLELPTVGRCLKTNVPILPRTIQIDWTYWRDADDETRLNIMFHELGHCDLDCDHQNEVPGIMNQHTTSTPSSNKKIEAMFKECK